MTTRTVVHLMRHGEVHNPDGVLYGRMSGYRLSERGGQMVRHVADVLVSADHDIRAVISSPLQRAQESARPTAEAFEVPLRTDDRLIEAGNSFEGFAVQRDKAMLAHPRYWPRYVDPTRPSWGEAYTDIAARMRDAIIGALDLGTGGEVLMVSHQLPIWTARRFVERRPLWHDPRRRQCSLASMTSLVFEGRTLMGMNYWEPAAEFLAGASDVTPGTSAAAENRGSGE